MTEHDASWDALTETWQAAEPVPHDLSGFSLELKRRARLRLLMVAGEVILTAALIWLSVQLLGSGGPDGRALILTGLWLFWLVATVFAWWNRRGQWERSVASTDDFASLSLERAGRKIRVVWFTVGLLVAQLAFVGVLIGTGLVDELGGSSLSLAGVFAGVSAVYLIWCRWYYRRARSEESYYRDLQRERAARDPTTGTPSTGS